MSFNTITLTYGYDDTENIYKYNLSVYSKAVVKAIVTLMYDLDLINEPEAINLIRMFNDLVHNALQRDNKNAGPVFIEFEPFFKLLNNYLYRIKLDGKPYFKFVELAGLEDKIKYSESIQSLKYHNIVISDFPVAVHAYCPGNTGKYDLVFVQKRNEVIKQSNELYTNFLNIYNVYINESDIYSHYTSKLDKIVVDNRSVLQFRKIKEVAIDNSQSDHRFAVFQYLSGRYSMCFTKGYTELLTISEIINFVIFFLMSFYTLLIGYVIYVGDKKLKEDFDSYFNIER